MTRLSPLLGRARAPPRRGEQVHTHLVQLAVARLYARGSASREPGGAPASDPGAEERQPSNGQAAAGGVKGGGWAGRGAAAGGTQGLCQGLGDTLDACALEAFGGAVEVSRALAAAPGREAARCLLAVLLDCLLAPVRPAPSGRGGQGYACMDLVQLVSVRRECRGWPAGIVGGA